ncbi:MAG: TetR family transcriptional regulator C-terminal domain-containing protein, partial [Janthinobacterium lividum]
HDDVLQALIDGIGVGVSEILDGGKGALQLEIFAEAARNPGIAALVQDADRATLQKLHDLLVSGRQARGLPVERSLIAGRCEAIASMMEGLYLRAVQNPALDQATLTKAIQTAITPLVFSP